MKTFLLYDQLEQLSPYVNQTLQKQIREGKMHQFEAWGQCQLICFQWCGILESYLRPNRLTLCCLPHHIFFICENETVRERLTEILKEEETTVAKTLHSFFTALLMSDTDQMSQLEERAARMEDAVLKGNTEDFLAPIIAMRKELFALKRYYGQIKEILEGLLENQNRWFSEEALQAFRRLDKKTDRLLSQALNLRDYVTQVREAYQSQIDIEQNKLMKIFTVVTTIFLPLTLIAGWYGMNFPLPEFKWKLGYPYVILLSMAVAIILLLFFKRKKWF